MWPLGHASNSGQRLAVVLHLFIQSTVVFREHHRDFHLVCTERRLFPSGPQRTCSVPGLQWRSRPSSGVSLTGKKKVFRYQFFQKSPRALHVLNHGWWQLAVGGWRRLAVGSWQLAVGGGWWWLAAVGGWPLVVGGGWQWLAVGGWSPLAVGGGWWRLVAVGS